LLESGPSDRPYKIGKVDVAILPKSDDGHILSPAWADEVMRRLGARIVIPSHYFIEHLVVPNAAGLESADKWVNRHEHTMLEAAELPLSPAIVSHYRQHVMYFGSHVAFPLSRNSPMSQSRHCHRCLHPRMAGRN
jgi:hypothetical protein